jgi:DDE_Tnp_1-associated
MIATDTRACRPIILDPSRSHPTTHADPLQPTEAPHLLAYLATIHDPRTRRGRRHPLLAILAVAAAAVLTGARSMTAIAEWATDIPQPVRAALGAHRDAPDHWAIPAEATIRRTLARLDPDALATAIGAWLADRDHPDRRRRALAVDGRTLRGARCNGRQVHLLAVMEHTTRAVLANARSTAPPARSPGCSSGRNRVISLVLLPTSAWARTPRARTRRGCFTSARGRWCCPRGLESRPHSDRRSLTSPMART